MQITVKRQIIKDREQKAPAPVLLVQTIVSFGPHKQAIVENLEITGW